MDIVGTKVLVAILFGVIRFAFGILPIQICSWLAIDNVDTKKRVINTPRRRLLDYGIVKLQSFGGGVLFATCFLHMMPEVYYSVEELRAYGVLKGSYPYSQLVVSLGFFLIYFVEEISHWLIQRAPKVPCKNKMKIRASSTIDIISAENSLIPESLDVTHSTTLEIDEEKIEKNLNDFQDNSFVDDKLNTEVVVDEAVQTEDDQNMDFEEELNEELEEMIQKEVKTQQQILRCVLIIVALSFHAIFEGLAIGLQHSVANIWYLFTAVSVHSATILFCIGLEIYLAGTRMKTIILHMLFLAITSPIGVILGLIVSLTAEQHSQAKSLAVVLLEGLSAGTILYITFFEVLIREKERRMCRVNRASYIAAGFGLMAGLEIAKMT